MPIARTYLYVCKKCGHFQNRKAGDVYPNLNLLNPCPKCGSIMKQSSVDFKGIFSKIIGEIG